METWSENRLPDIKTIQKRLISIFPREIDVNGYITREMGAKTVFVMLYGFCINGKEWLRTLQSAKALRDIANRWYKPNTRESIRDETLREMVRLNAVLKKPGLATTSPKPGYSLQLEFSELFNPEIEGEELEKAIYDWKKKYLSQSALARTALVKRLAIYDSDRVLVQLPNGETRAMAPGPSSELEKAVVEQFTNNFLSKPAIVLMSESANKLLIKDDDLCKAIGFHIDVSSVLPDLILADLEETRPMIIFVECVATDGPINDRRKKELIALAEKANYREDECCFVTVFRDRTDQSSRKLVPSIAWGTFIWYASEPEEIIYLFKKAGKEKRTLSKLLSR